MADLKIKFTEKLTKQFYRKDLQDKIKDFDLKKFKCTLDQDDVLIYFEWILPFEDSIVEKVCESLQGKYGTNVDPQDMQKFIECCQFLKVKKKVILKIIERCVDQAENKLMMVPIEVIETLKPVFESFVPHWREYFAFELGTAITDSPNSVHLILKDHFFGAEQIVTLAGQEWKISFRDYVPELNEETSIVIIEMKDKKGPFHALIEMKAFFIGVKQVQNHCKKLFVRDQNSWRSRVVFYLDRVVSDVRVLITITDSHERLQMGALKEEA